MKNRRVNMHKETPHICLDARMYEHSGIGVYIQQQIAALQKDKSVQLTLLVPDYIPAWKDIRQIIFPAKIYSMKEQLLYPFKIPPCDIFWSPHYNVPLLPIRASMRWVTLHDVYHLRYAHTLSLPKRYYARLCFAAACHRSDKIITVSDFSASEILSFFDVAGKIEVRHNIVDTEKFSRPHDAATIQQVLKKYQIDFPYILFVGNVKPHKNLITLLRAVESIHSEMGNIKLLVVGKKEGFITEDNEVKNYIAAHPDLASKIHFTDQVSHDELPVLYQQAQLFVFPSLYEGFGYPPLEAVAAGVPVLCSHAGPMPEVCGDKVHYFDPTDAAALASLIRSKLGSSSC
jgi:glycosyltransferase involved in cell wall biosynthesis